MNKITAKSVNKTKQLAAKVASQLRGGEVLALVGDLGAGKTTFTQGLAEYFEVEEHASSPTYTLVNEYQVKKSINKKINKSKINRIIHLDCYRLESSQELIDIGFQDYLDSENSVVIIEWAEKVKAALPQSTKWIYFEHGACETERIIRY